MGTVSVALFHTTVVSVDTVTVFPTTVVSVDTVTVFLTTVVSVDTVTVFPTTVVSVDTVLVTVFHTTAEILVADYTSYRGYALVCSPPP